MLLTLLLLGCTSSPEPDDTGDTGDTSGCPEPGDTATTRTEGPVTFADDDDTCDRTWPAADLDVGGCGWGFVWGRDDARALQVELALPPGDLPADHDWLYSLAVGGDATVEVLALDGGTDETDFWSCSDYTETLTGTLWTGVSGRVEVEARWVCDTVDPYCADAEVEFHAVVRLVDLAVADAAGTCRELPDEDHRVLLGVTECGG